LNSTACDWLGNCDAIGKAKSMLKIQRRANGDVVFTVVGRLDLDNAGELFGLLAVEQAGRTIVLDLKDLVLVDREGVRMLRGCEAQGIVLRNCPPYIRAWMAGVAS
jgi:anti-anti-sigma regulatory factor